jgi:membrane associated rhomboid family serine protease
VSEQGGIARIIEWVRPRLSWPGYVTIALIALNLAVYAAELVNPAAVINGLGEIGMRLYAGEYYRLLTSAFVHLAPPQLWHIIGNMVFLALLGYVLEPILGPARFTLLYVMCALAGSALSYLILDPDRVAIGASGAIYGLLGGVVTVAKRTRQSWLFWVLLLVYFLQMSFVNPAINWSVHVGGLIMGLILTPLLVYPPKPRQLAAAGAGCLVAVVVMGAILVIRTNDLGQEAGTLNGVYLVSGERTRCSGSFTGCGGEQRFETRWTLRNCGGGSCTVGARYWTDDSVLSGTDGRWKGIASRKPENSSHCLNQPMETKEYLEIMQGATQDGDSGPTPTLHGTMRAISKATRCRMSTATWTFTATRVGL